MQPQNPPLQPAQTGPMPPTPPQPPVPPAVPPGPQSFNVQPQPQAGPMPQMPNSAPAMQLNPAYGHSKLATASLILGIVSLPASILNFLTLPIPVTGLVLGIVSLKTKKGLALAGIILSIIGIILSGIFLAVGLKIEHDKGSGSSSSTLSHGVNGSVINSTCYSFTLPSDFVKSDVQKNADCVTLVVKADKTDDLVVNSSDLAAPVPDSEKDAYLKNLVKEVETQAGSVVQLNNTKFTTVDGVRAYEATGSETYGSYKYAGFIAMLSPKDYISVSGAKLRAFIIAYDSASSQDRLDNIVQSWHWQ